MAKIEIKGTIVADDDKWIYEWFGIAATCPRDVHEAVKAACGEELEVEINSGGGDVLAGNEIYTALRMYKGKVGIVISGMAASAASYIATARRCEISPVGLFMIHNASGGARGDYHAMDKESEILQTVNRAIATAYMDKTDMPLEELLRLMDKEAWLTAEKALEYGFVDGIVQNQDEQRSGSEASLLEGGGAAIYNAATVLDRKTIDKTKRMLLGASGSRENAASESEPSALSGSVLDNKYERGLEEEDMDDMGEKISTAEDLAARYPELTQKIREDAFSEAREAENKRLKAIDEISAQISAEIVKEAKYGERRMTAETLALEAFRRNGIMAKGALEDMKADMGESHAETVGANAWAADDEKLDRETRVKNLAEKFRRK
ncbi:Clp protease ClpP [bacterium D16-50]|nr:Clp protease ClpP [bacterium D16-50]